jgi:nucleotide-binding universal stress UspA family protein
VQLSANSDLQDNRSMTNESVATRTNTSRIVVGVDGSEPSIAALRWAAFEAHRRNSDMLVVSCYSVPVYGGEMAAVSPTNEDLDMIKEAAAAVVSRATELVAKVDSQLAVDGLVEMSSASVAISQAAHAGDEIVVGATGHNSFMDGLLGSVAMGVMHRSHVPVIVVPEKAVAEVGPRMRKIVVGVDGSASSLQALEWAYGEALSTGAELTVVHGWIYPYDGPRTSVSEPRVQMELDATEELNTSLESLGARLRGGSVHVHPKVVEQSPAEALLGEASDADLLVVGSRGRGLLLASLLGSVCRTVVHHAMCPVAIIRQPEA